MASIIRKPSQRYYTTPQLLHAQLPGARLGFAEQLGYYARTPGAKPPVTPRSVAVAKANAAAKQAAAIKANAAPTSMQAIVNDYWSHRQTPAQQRLAASQEANALVNKGVRGINTATAAEKATLDAQAARAQNYALALAKISAGDPAKIQAAYQSSADRLAGLGQGLTGSALEAQQAAAAQSSEEVARATHGAVPTVRGSVDPAAARSALLYSNVTIPGSTLEEEAASAYANALARNKATNFGIEQIAQDYLHKGGDLTKESARKIADLRATRPELFQKALDSFRSAGRQDVATILQAMALENTQANTNSLIGTRAATTKQGATKVKQAGTKITQAGTKITQDYSKLTGIDKKTGLLLPGFYYKNKSDEQRKVASKIPGAMHVDPNNPYKVVRNIPAAGKTPSATSGTTNTKNVQAIITNSRKAIRDVVNKATSQYASYNGILADTGINPYKPLMSFADAKAGLLGYFPPKYRKDARAIRAVEDQLAALGYKNPRSSSQDPAVNPNASGPIDVRPKRK